MFSHVVVGADDLEASKRFYDAVLGTLGVPEGVVDALGRVVYQHDGGRFLVTKPTHGGAASAANGGTIGFKAASPEAADVWHAAGLANSGTAAEDPPGVRHAAERRVLYLAYLRDPAGNKLCASHRLNP